MHLNRLQVLYHMASMELDRGHYTNVTLRQLQESVALIKDHPALLAYVGQSPRGQKRRRLALNDRPKRRRFAPCAAGVYVGRTPRARSLAVKRGVAMHGTAAAEDRAAFAPLSRRAFA